MKIIGIIAEYNPFHNGHIYHIKKIKELYPDSLIILVLSGLFTQRGEISILTKEAKTNIALLNNVDIVLELPLFYATQSADIFAETAVKILNYFHVNKIIFGSETNNSQKLMELASTEINDKSYDKKVKEYLKEGLNYPTALAKALNQKDFSFEPNDLLGISYAKAILKNRFSIELVTIKRTNDYKDLKSTDKIISATNIRNKLINKENIKKYIPDITYKNIINVNNDKYFELLKYQILTNKNLDSILDCDEGIENRLISIINKSNSLDEFIKNIKTKRYTYNKLNRLCIHILTNLEKTENKDAKLDYIKVLGFNELGQKYLNKIKKDINIPLIPDKDSIIYQYELKCSLLYDLINKTDTYSFEINNKPIKKSS